MVLLCKEDISICSPFKSYIPLFTGVTVKISLPSAGPVYDTESINVVLSVVVILSGVAEANVAEPPLTDKEKSAADNEVPFASAATVSLKTTVTLVLFELTEVEVIFGGLFVR